jgi:hypothetical protein
MNISVAAWGSCITLRDDATSVDIRDSLTRAGFNVVPLGDHRAKHSLMFEFDRFAFHSHFRNLGREDRSLVIFEPKSVNPSNYSKRTRSKFLNIWAPTELMKAAETDIVYKGGGFYKPVGDLLMEKNQEPTAAPEFDVAIVNENKFSLVKGSLYTLRADALSALVNSGRRVGLAGKNWDRNSFWHYSKQIWHLVDCLRNETQPDIRLIRRKLPSRDLVDYEGKTESVLNFYGRAKFALVIENEAVYVTEKLFNAIASGSVPIYVGPKLSEFNIPEDVAIQAYPNVGSILESIEQFDESRRMRIIEAGNAFLLGSATETNWMHRNVLNRLATLIRKRLEYEGVS